jgi:di/tricarboxylate transporter
VISPNSPLIGKKVRESQFRSHYNAVIIAMHRSGERIRQKIGDVVFHPGDTILILAKHSFLNDWYHSKDFYLVSKIPSQPSKPRRYSIFSLCILGSMILCMILNIVPILLAVSFAAIMLIVTRCLTTEEARNSVEWNVLLIIASAFGIARAIENSGVAHFLANRLIFMVDSLGVLGILAGVYFITNLYTNIITNNAAAALLFPIALSVSNQMGYNPRPFFIAVAIAASASFATPIGYQTNLMVYGPGGYRFKDFLRIGIPMNFLIGICAIIIIYVLYF